MMSACARCVPCLVKPSDDAGRPAARQLLERADIQIAVVEEALQLRHVARQEAPVLADAVAADRRGARRAPAGARNSSVRASASAVVTLLARTRASSPEEPCCFWFQSSMPREHLFGLMDRDDRTLGDDGQLLVGHDGGDFDDDIASRA